MKTKKKQNGIIYFTRTERRLIEVLADGKPHRREELLPCLRDELATWANTLDHLKNIRKKVRIRNEDIICQLIGRAIHYRHIKCLVPHS